MQRKMESSSDTKHSTDTRNATGTKKAKAEVCRPSSHPPQSKNPLDFLAFNSDDSSVSVVCIQDCGSQLQKVQIDVSGVPTEGLVDTGADNTIMGPDFYKKVEAVAGLKKKQFKPADKVLDGHLDLDVSFVDKACKLPFM